MKFQHLPIGARFEYQGKTYLKTGPLSASSEDGQRMIPRYAVLRPLDAAAKTAEPAPRRSLDAAAVSAAFEVFYGECAGLLTDPDAARALAEARQRFLAALDRAGGR